MLATLWYDDLSSIGDSDDYISSDDEKKDAKSISRHENETETNESVWLVSATLSQQPTPPAPEFIG